MSAPKINVEWGVLGKVEATYGTDPVPTNADDGVLVLENPLVDLDYMHDGSRAGRYGHRGATPRVGQSGRFGTVTLVQEAAGPLAAYGAASNATVHVGLRAAGFDVTYGGAGVDAVYVPGTGASVALQCFANGEKRELLGAYADLEISSDGPDVPRWNFAYQGMVTNEPTDVTLPAITYPHFDTLPPKSEGISFDIGGAGLRVASWALRLNRVIGARRNDNASDGHGGFTPGERNPELELTVEARALSEYNPYSKLTAGTKEAVSWSIGSVQYNQFAFALGNAQLINVDDSDDGPNALWTLTYAVLPTTFGGTDDITITCS